MKTFWFFLKAFYQFDDTPKGTKMIRFEKDVKGRTISSATKKFEKLLHKEYDQKRLSSIRMTTTEK
jgi:hypothetical protein